MILIFFENSNDFTSSTSNSKQCVRKNNDSNQAVTLDSNYAKLLQQIEILNDSNRKNTEENSRLKAELEKKSISDINHINDKVNNYNLGKRCKYTPSESSDEESSLSEVCRDKAVSSKKRVHHHKKHRSIEHKRNLVERIQADAKKTQRIADLELELSKYKYADLF